MASSNFTACYSDYGSAAVDVYRSAILMLQDIRMAHCVVRWGSRLTDYGRGGCVTLYADGFVNFSRCVLEWSSARDGGGIAAQEGLIA